MKKLIAGFLLAASSSAMAYDWRYVPAPRYIPPPPPRYYPYVPPRVHHDHRWVAPAAIIGGMVIGAAIARSYDTGPSVTVIQPSPQPRVVESDRVILNGRSFQAYPCITEIINEYGEKRQEQSICLR